MQTVLDKTEAQTIETLFKDIFKVTDAESATFELQSILGCTNYHTNISNGVKTIGKSVFVENNVKVRLSTSLAEVDMLVCLVLGTNEEVNKPEDIYTLDDSLVFSSIKTVSPAIYHEYIYNEDPKIRIEPPLAFDMSFSLMYAIDLVEELIIDKADGFIPMLDIATTLLNENPIQNVVDENVISKLIEDVKAQALSFIS
ncbi:hypothetical protein [Psychrobacter sp. UBA3480]|uniref:hypothetical protein n=1 Tax=Psychrobacter sp. UBA3480 TaxID=1947350 RepID=UPI0025FE8660|nr:hypothetical protein [Psychrobacter sp. UBA3480]